MGFTESDRRFMRHAVSLAEKGRGRTSPNPMVGAVIVKDGSIISEGYHRKAGEDHAEIAAINNCGVSVRGSTMYVSLEPCTFTGKTPPCTRTLIQKGFHRVVIGSIDPNPRARGSGIRQLRDAGIEVKCGLYEKEIKRQNEVFFKNMQEGTPFVCAKIASSIDGRLAACPSGREWITGPFSRKKVQEMRREYGCVLTGINTVLADDPTLFPKQDPGGTVEKNLKDFLSGDGARKFCRVILDSGLRLPPSSAVAGTADRIKTVVFTGMKTVGQARAHGLDDICIEYSRNGSIVPEEVLKTLYHKYSVVSVMLEAGPAVLTSFLNAGLIDKYMIFMAPLIIGGQSRCAMFGDTGAGNISDCTRLSFEPVQTMGDDILITAYPENMKEARCLPE